jgi:hypothetical protein
MLPPIVFYRSVFFWGGSPVHHQTNLLSLTRPSFLLGSSLKRTPVLSALNLNPAPAGNQPRGLCDKNQAACVSAALNFPLGFPMTETIENGII